MRAQGMDPPSPPFVVVPGAMTLYHEWGHYVDRRWSQPDQEIRFSFRWFSAFYRIRARVRQPWPCHLVHLAKPAPAAPTPELDAAEAALTWYRVSSELFANLFEHVDGDGIDHFQALGPAQVHHGRLVLPGRLAGLLEQEGDLGRQRVAEGVAGIQGQQHVERIQRLFLPVQVGIIIGSQQLRWSA